jgi:hypothetical protein
MDRFQAALTKAKTMEQDSSEPEEEENSSD